MLRLSVVHPDIKLLRILKSETSSHLPDNAAQMNRGQGKDEAVSLAVQCALPLNGGYSFEVARKV